MSQSDALVVAEDLSKHYATHQAVGALSLKLKRGDVLGLLGPNGAGKSTTMNMLTGNLAPSEGSVSICGYDLFAEPNKAKAHIGYLPELPPLYPDMTVSEYLFYAAGLHKISVEAQNDAVDLAMQRCDLMDVKHRLISNISKGYKQRVGIAQAILHQPDVIVLDEPTVGLDPIQIQAIRDLVEELATDHAIILSTHILSEVQAVCTAVQIINRGRAIYHANLADMHNESGSQFTLRCETNTAEALVSGCAGVASATSMDGLLYQLTLADDVAASECLQALVNGGVKVAEFAQQNSSLEQLFTRLVHTEQEVA